ncbi:MAG: bifunctional pyr operon transcriptional regulator/uracil phosphoribosyltransferase PyrR [Desulfobacterales bacterium]|nr:bifunctional pyr operon transcriptional regulator/uracil phosphoribosyltransferase PyrR [Desulfobacterales bacterium]
MNSTGKTLYQAAEIKDALSRLAAEIVDSREDPASLALVGIHTRGVFLAKRIRQQIINTAGLDIPAGEMDINLYRDDWTRISHHPEVRSTRIDFNVNQRQIVLMDDVLYTGRTIRAAMDAIIDFGRPERIELAVLIDRGHRELPIQPDYTGMLVQTRKNDVVNVLLTEYDNADRVDLIAG